MSASLREQPAPALSGVQSLLDGLSLRMLALVLAFCMLAALE